MEFNRVVGSKVEEHWVELDLFGLTQQLGAMPEPEHSEEASSPRDDESNFREAALFTNVVEEEFSEVRALKRAEALSRPGPSSYLYSPKRLVEV
jgi:hypothetical protein